MKDIGDNWFNESQNIKIKTASGISKSYWRRTGIKKDIKKDGIDVYHGLSNELPSNISSAKSNCVVTIHDLIFKHYPKQYNRWDVLLYDKKFKSACKEADVIIAISESTKRDIIDFYNIPEEKIRIIYQSFDGSFANSINESVIGAVQAKYNLPSEFYLFVGNLNKRKNALNIVKALSLIDDSKQIPLLIVTNGGEQEEAIRKYAIEHGLERLVKIIKGVSNQGLPVFYKMCSAFVYPSFCEGFGIPVIESIASGTLTITSNRSSLVEAGGKAAIHVNPDSVDELSDAMYNILSNARIREDLLVHREDHLKTFDAELVTRQLFDLYSQF